MTEYIKVNALERTHGERSLLESQLNLLDVIKILKNYKEHRKKELLLKIELKNKTLETLEHLKILKKSLPRAHLIDKEESADKESFSIEKQLADIRSKLEKLQE